MKPEEVLRRVAAKDSRYRHLVSPPLEPLPQMSCRHLGEPSRPPTPESSPVRTWLRCELGLGTNGVVCRCECTPAKCSSYTAGDVLYAENGAGGLGDGLLGLMAIAAYRRDHPDSFIRYGVGTTALDFVSLFDGPDRVERSLRVHTEEPLSHALQLNRDYGLEAAGFTTYTRGERYARNIGTSRPALPRLRDREGILRETEDLDGLVLLAPFSTDAGRTWPLVGWLELEDQLSELGYRTGVVHSQLTPQVREFRRSVHLVGLGARRLTGAVLRAVGLVGCDSGPAHLGGILGCPVVVVNVTPFGPEVIFGDYPRVRYASGPTGNINDVAVRRVVEQVGYLCDNISAGRSLLYIDRLTTLQREATRVSSLGGSVAELGVYLGGSAAVLSHFSRAQVHLFDTFAGIPDSDINVGGHQRGDFPSDLESVKQFLVSYSPVFHVGVFPRTAPHDMRFRLVHVDGDTEQTTRAAAEYFAPRMVPGGVIIWDDYGWHMCPGVRRVVDEWFPGRVVHTAPGQVLVRF